MAPVRVNVYDLTPQNNVMYWMGVGVYHTGVEVHGVEYAFGGHDYDLSGVFATNPREAPGQAIFRETIHVGETNLSPAEVQRLIQKMGQQYKGNRYHLLQRNCNHFTNDLCYQLVGKPAPHWVNRLADLAIMLHCLLPATWVPPLQKSGALPSEYSNERQVLVRAPATESIVCPPRADDATVAKQQAAYQGRI